MSYINFYLIIFLWTFSLWSFFSFLFLFPIPCCLHLPIYSYKVTTAVCLYASHNKLLNFFKKSILWQLLCWFLFLPTLYIYTIIGDVLKTSTTKTLSLYCCSFPIFLSSSFLYFLLSLFFLCFSFFSHSYLFYSSPFII